MRRFLFSLCVGAALTFGASAHSNAQTATTAAVQTAKTLSYQGLITKSDGQPVKDGDYAITVTLYSDKDGAKAVWSGTYTSRVTGGVFNVALGSGDAPLPAVATMDGALFAGVTFGGEEMRPLTPLSSVPFAMNVADGAITSNKMGTDYVSGVTLNGQKVTGRGQDLNIQTDGLEATIDPASNTLMLRNNQNSAIVTKGAGAQSNTQVFGTLTVTDQTYLQKSVALGTSSYKGTVVYNSASGSNHTAAVQALLSGDYAANRNYYMPDAGADANFLFSSTSGLTQYGVLYGGGGGASISATAAGAANTVLHGNGAGAPTFSDIVNADVNAAAAIAGTKISPNFGSQNVTTSGNVSSTAGTIIGGASGGAAGALALWDGATHKATVVSATQAANTTYTIPDAGGAANFVMTAGNQTVGGTKTFSALKLSGAMDANSNQIHNVTDPTSLQDAATKNYVDNLSLAVYVKWEPSATQTTIDATHNAYNAIDLTKDWSYPSTGDFIKFTTLNFPTPALTVVQEWTPTGIKTIGVDADNWSNFTNGNDILIQTQGGGNVHVAGTYSNFINENSMVLGNALQDNTNWPAASLDPGLRGRLYFSDGQNVSTQDPTLSATVLVQGPTSTSAAPYSQTLQVTNGNISVGGIGNGAGAGAMLWWDATQNTGDYSTANKGGNGRFMSETAATLDGSGNIATTGTLTLSSLTANRPLRLNGSNIVTAALINLSDNTNTVTSVLPIGNGGTNSSTALNNGRVMVSSTGSIVENASGTLHQLLHGDLSWAAVGLTNEVTGILPIANGGTNGSTATAGFDNLAPTTTQGDLIYRNATNNVRLAAGTTGMTLHTNGGGGNPSWSKVDLSASAEVANTLPVGNGGTGQTSFTNHGVILGAGASALGVTSVGATNTLLHGNTGADPTYSDIVNADVDAAAAIAFSKLASLATGHIIAGNAGTASDVTLGGDATIGNTGTLTLATVNANTGTWGDATHVSTVTLNGKGLATAASNTLITGLAAGTSNLANTHILVGNASNVTADVALSGDATLANTGALTLATVNANTGTWGDATHVSTVTLNGKGLATAASNTLITGLAAGTTNLTTGHVFVGAGGVAADVALSGDATIATGGALTLATVNGNVGTFGSSSTSHPNITVNAKGLITAASNTAITGLAAGTSNLANTHILVGNASNVTADVALSGDATLANTGALTLATVNGNVGTFGSSSTSHPNITVNAKGLITAASNTAITGLAAGTSNLANAHIFVGTAGNVTGDVAMSGDVSITNAGVTSVNSVQNGAGATIVSAINSQGAQINGDNIKTDATLSVTANQLGIALNHSNTWTADQTIGTSGSNHSLTVNGTEAVTGALTLGIGTTGATYGQLVLKDNTSTDDNAITVQTVAHVTGNYTVTIPDPGGTANFILDKLAGGGAQNIQNITLSTALPLSSGGTGNNAVGAQGAVAYSNGSTAYAFSNAPANAQFLVAVVGGSSTPTWVSMSGDATTSNAGAITLATVNGNVGTFGTATSSPTFTVNAKGLITAASNTAITGLAAGTSNLANTHILVGNASNVTADVALSGDATLANTGALTLATVNGNVGTFGTATSIPTFTVNGKGLITAASNTAITGLAPGAVSLANTHILVGNGSGVAADVALSGDATISNTGAITVTNAANLSGSHLTGDVSNIADAVTVTGIQSVPVITTAPTNGQVLTYVLADNKWEPQSASVSSLTFTNITTGINSQAAMTVNTGASLNYSNSGTINASSLIGSTWASPAAIGTGTASSGKFTTLQSTSLGTGIVHSDASGNFTSSLIVNTDVSGTAAIAYSKLNLGTSIVNGDINGSAAIAYSKLNLGTSIVNGDINGSAAIAFSKLAALTSAHLLVGNGSNVATDVAASGDVTLANTGAFTVTALQGRSVSNAAPSNGDFLKYNTGTSKWEPNSSGSSSVGFDGITGATNTTAAMVVGAGASLTYNGGSASSGDINASKLLGSTWASPAAIGTGTAAAGTFTTLTGSTVTATTASSGMTIGTGANATNLTSTASGSAKTISFPNATGTLVLDSRSVSAGTGLSGGGDLSANRTISLDLTASDTWTGTETFAPTGGEVTGLAVQQTSGAHTTADIFDVTNSGGGTKYLSVDHNGNTTITGTTTFVGPVTTDQFLISSSTAAQTANTTNGYVTSSVATAAGRVAMQVTSGTPGTVRVRVTNTKVTANSVIIISSAWDSHSINGIQYLGNEDATTRSAGSYFEVLVHKATPNASATFVGASGEGCTLDYLILN